ncbi:hypothetical protein [Parahaliea aestuarii]|uniref:Uncharacterized protein n=1 Tax=Parahaliea aestuarii TaxID=1852021 RepID=A0A5C8ZZG0_9GAMM|nr:hypothetical protein [Parahaliea aestuarii]TXS93189.1 hypothetical protein FVW59_04880 [Parahaliea aestuarii]
MLNEQSYHIAMAAYLGAAVLALVLFAFWLRKSWRPAWIGLVVLLGAALLLTPAFPEAGVETLAPALIVAVFQWLTVDISAAEHALRPLAVMVGAALVLALLLGLTVLRHRRVPATRDEDAEAA